MARKKKIGIRYWEDPSKLYPDETLSDKQLEERELAFNDLGEFIRLCVPEHVMSHCHEDLAKWITTSTSMYKLVLYPRDHGKSRFAAFYAAWNIVRNPAITIIYASATAEKAEEMMRFIKVILTSKRTRRYFPGLTHVEEGKRKLWNNTNIIVDHKYREEMAVVDSTIMTCGETKNITGKHCDLLILDDMVVKNNNTDQGRKDTRSWFAQAASIMSVDSEMFVVGTRYHPKDLYSHILDLHVHEYDEEGNKVGDAKPMFDVLIRNVEEDGVFLWERTKAPNGKWFGFNKQILEEKKRFYEVEGDLVSFYSQYYNNPNDSSTAPIGRDLFQYYDRQELKESNGNWYIGNTLLALYAAIDPAYTTGKKSDYTALVVGGIDKEGNRYLIHGERFKTEKPSYTYERLEDVYLKYAFKHLSIEAVGAGHAVALDIKDRLYEAGIRIPVEFFKPNQRNVDKEMRILNTLEPLYRSGSVYHFRGGIAETLEEELTMVNPPHDDLKDAWFMVNMDMKVTMQMRNRNRKTTNKVVQFNSRFGGVAFR